jgi:hypothetical protein
MLAKRKEDIQSSALKFQHLDNFGSHSISIPGYISTLDLRALPGLSAVYILRCNRKIRLFCKFESGIMLQSWSFSVTSTPSNSILVKPRVHRFIPTEAHQRYHLGNAAHRRNSTPGRRFSDFLEQEEVRYKLSFGIFWVF